MPSDVNRPLYWTEVSAKCFLLPLSNDDESADMTSPTPVRDMTATIRALAMGFAVDLKLLVMR